MRAMFGWLVTAALIAALLTLVVVRPFLFDVLQTSGTVMLPTVAPDTYVRVAKQGLGIASLAALRWRYAEPTRVPQRGEVIVYRRGAEQLIGRVLGLPGDTVRYRGDGSVVVNEVVVAQKPVAGAVQQGFATFTEQLDGRRWQVRLWTRYGDDRPAGKRRVAPGTLFVLGDSRDEAVDSRELGGVPILDIVGIVDRVSGDPAGAWPTELPFAPAP